MESADYSTTPPAIVAPSGVRPKAYRRPPHWVSPHSPAPSDVVPTDGKHALAPFSEPSHPVPAVRASDPTFGLALVIIVLLTNGFLALALRSLDNHTAHNGDLYRASREPTRLSPAPDITLFTSPINKHRILRPSDSTDSVTTFSYTSSRTISDDDE